jgi:hypothetical protein
VMKGESVTGDMGRMLEASQDGYINSMIRFTADDMGNRVMDAAGNDIQGSKGPIMLVHTATQDCTSWMTSTKGGLEAYPITLFSAGYDVWMACRRGTELSRAHSDLDLAVNDDEMMYFDYDTAMVGMNDIGSNIDFINESLVAEEKWACGDKVQIMTHSLGTGEVLAGLALDEDLAAKVNLVTNLAPCAVTTYQNPDETERRMLSIFANHQAVGDAPRELEDIVDEDMPLRELSHSSYYNKSSYWDRTRIYCDKYPSSCYNYCDWYPSFCDAFCVEFP